MILDQPGQVYVYGPFQQSFYIGQQIVTNDNSAYVGLTGEITQITDGEDLETENSGPDVYCRFDLQSAQNEFLAPLVKKRHNLSDDETELDELIMSLDMIEPKMQFQMNPLEEQMYILTCFIEFGDVADDFMLLTSRDPVLLRNRLHEHSEQNRYISGQKGIWTNEDSNEGVYRRSFKGDNNLYVCYSVIPVNYERGHGDAQ